jgi:hypothetical protein
MPAPQHADACLALSDSLERLLDHFERLWRSILKHQLHPTLKME